MSYARFGDESSVYVFLSTQGYLECCGCSLTPSVFEPTLCTTTNEMLAHLREHDRAGHKVPASCVERLKEREHENDAWIAEQHAQLVPDERKPTDA